MATLFIGVWGDATVTLHGKPIQEMAVTITGTSAQSAVITGPSGSRSVRRAFRVYTDTDCFVHWGSNPTALNDGTAGRPLGADNPEVWEIESGEKIAVIERT